jgi:hypothetical protein
VVLTLALLAFVLIGNDSIDSAEELAAPLIAADLCSEFRSDPVGEEAKGPSPADPGASYNYNFGIDADSAGTCLGSDSTGGASYTLYVVRDSGDVEATFQSLVARADDLNQSTGTVSRPMIVIGSNWIIEAGLDNFEGPGEARMVKDVLGGEIRRL